MSLERIVRPFQTRETTPPRVVLNGKLQTSAAADTVKIDIGKSWSVKTLNGSETIDVSYYMKKWMKEKLKQT